MKPTQFVRNLHRWFLENKREFPWRIQITPYRVWVSEVMLQQTRASVVVPYFIKWMELFPDIFTLAKAPIEQVIKTWEGLGYYSRARNLWLGAQQICKEFGGEIPSSHETLSQIKGIGPYTSAAILSFAFHQKTAPVDGNVLRVMSRYLWIQKNVDSLKTKKEIALRTEELLDPETPWITAEALIELGASICLPRPHCSVCPIAQECVGLIRGNPELLPVKNQKNTVRSLIRQVAILEWNGSVLIQKQETGKVMADLYEFPFEEKKENASFLQFKKQITARFSCNILQWNQMTPQTHSFTRYQVKLIPYKMVLAEKVMIDGWDWVPISELSLFPFSSGHRKIVQQIQEAQ